MLRTFLIAAAVAVVGSSANATLYVNTFSGVMRDGTDATGVFGLTPGTDLAGERVTLTFTVDDASPNFHEYSDAFSTRAISQSWFGPSPVTATITINGVSFSIPHDDDGSLYREGVVGAYAGAADTISYAIRAWNYNEPGQYTASYNIGLVAEDGVHKFLVSNDWRDISLLDVSGLRNPVAAFEIIKYDRENKVMVDNATGYVHWMEFNGARLPYPAIPEPATWALMIMGFGATGAMLRRRYAVA